MQSFEDRFGGVVVSDVLSHKENLYYFFPGVIKQRNMAQGRWTQTVEQTGQVAAALNVGAPGASGTLVPQAPGRSGQLQNVQQLHTLRELSIKLDIVNLFRQ